VKTQPKTPKEPFSLPPAMKAVRAKCPRACGLCGAITDKGAPTCAAGYSLSKSGEKCFYCNKDGVTCTANTGAGPCGQKLCDAKVYTLGGTKGAHQGANATTCKTSCTGVTADKVFAADQVNASVAATLCNYAFSGSNTGFNGVSSQVVAKQQKGKYVTYYNEPGCIWPHGITDQYECALAVTDMWDKRPKNGSKSKLPTHSRGCYVQDTSVKEESATQGFKFAINQGIDSSDPERWSDSRSKRNATGCDLSKRNCQCPMGFNVPNGSDPGICIRNDVPKGEGGDVQAGQWCKLTANVKQGTRFKTLLTQGKCSVIASRAECSAHAALLGKTLEPAGVPQTRQLGDIAVPAAGGQGTAQSESAAGGKGTAQSESAAATTSPATSSPEPNPKGCFLSMTDQKMRYSPDTDGSCTSTNKCSCSLMCTHGQFGNLKGVARRRRTSFTLNSICRKPGVPYQFNSCPKLEGFTAQISSGILEGALLIRTIEHATDLCSTCVKACIDTHCSAIKYTRRTIYDTALKHFNEKPMNGSCTIYQGDATGLVTVKPSTDWRHIVIWRKHTLPPTIAPSSPPSPSHLAPKGASVCDYGKPVVHGDCMNAAIRAVPPTLERKNPMQLRMHSAHNGIPSGCSLYSPYNLTAVFKKGYQMWDPQFNSRRFSMNDGNYSLVCTNENRFTTKPTFHPTSVTPTNTPTSHPSIGPSVAPTNTWAPTPYPSHSPTKAPTPVPSFSPTAFPTSNDLNPKQLAIHRERASKTQAQVTAKKAKHNAIHKRVDDIKKEKNAKKRSIAMKSQAAVDKKRVALTHDMRKLSHFKEVCKNSTLPENELKNALKEVRLPPAAIASALHKVGILRSIRNAMLKLKRMEQFNSAHSMFALKQVGVQLFDATKEIQEKSVKEEVPQKLELSKQIVPT